VFGRVFRVPVWAAMPLVWAPLFVSASASAEEEAVRVAYVAPASCPDEQVFVARVRARTEHGRFADPGELARTFEVHLAEPEHNEGLSGQIEFIDVDGSSARRSVTGATCDEVASSLALIMALSIDDRVAQTASREREPSPSPPPAAVSAPTKETAPVLAASGTTRKGPLEPKSLHWRWQFGLNTGVLNWVSPSVAPMFGGFAELGAREHGGALRLSAFDARQTTLVSGVDTHFATDWLRLDLCPLALSVAPRVALSPCAGFDGGILSARASGSALVPKPSRTLFWAAGVVLARLTWEVKGRFLLGLDGELAAPFVHQKFVLNHPETPATPLFQVPTLGVGAKAGVGVRFP
jgi:hypothetical protein